MDHLSAEKNREKGAERAEKFLNRIGAYDFFEDIQKHPEKTREIPFERFQSFLTRINGIAREIPIRERRADGEGVYIGGFVGDTQVPRQEDKEGLLRMAYESAGHVRHVGDEKYMLPAVVNAVHLYADGNGRTSRVLHVLLTQHASRDELRSMIRSVLDDDGRFESLNIDPGLIAVSLEKIVLSNHGVRFSEEKNRWALPPEGFTRLFGVDRPRSEKGREFATLRDRDNWYAFSAAYDYLREHNLLEKCIFTQGEARGLSMHKMNVLLHEDEWQAIIDRYYQMKKEHVETLIRLFIEPEKYKSDDGSAELRDEFIGEIERQYKHFNEEVQASVYL